MRQLPGLRKLWSPYHVAVPAGVAAAPTLLARLARALFDPSYHDDDSFVAKGRLMFEARLPRLENPAISREVGMLLGNDLGQMRVQFSAKTYVVEPVYRDDGLGLWDFGEDAPTSGEPLDLAVAAVRLEQHENPDQELPPDRPEAERRAPQVPPAQRRAAIPSRPAPPFSTSSGSPSRSLPRP